jgi:site-specific DNA-methyltransferase (adenine-specific)
MYELIHANCIDILRTMPDKSVDCIVTDPPYIIGAGESGFDSAQCLRDIKKTGLNKGFDPAVLDQCLRIAKRPNFVFFASRLQLRDYLNWAHEHDLCWSLISWHKTNPLPLTASPYLPDTEYALHFTRGIRLGGNYRSKRQFYVQPSGKSPYEHPTVKPLNIIKNLVLNAATARGQLVLDPFMGSGTTGVAAIQLGHRFIGIEINGDYLEIAKRRIARASPDLQPRAKETTCEST